MPLTVGNTISCSTPSFGGGVNVWLGNIADLTSFTSGATGIYSAITMVATKVMYKFTCEPDTIGFKITSASNEKGQPTITTAIEFFIRQLSTSHRNNLAEIMDSCAACGLFAILEDASGVKWVIGYSDKYGKDRPLRKADIESNIGLKGSDDNGSKIVFTHVGVEEPKVFTGTVPV